MAKNNNDEQSKIELAKRIAEKSGSIKHGYNKVEGFFIKVFKFISDLFDRVLFNNHFSKLVAICLAALLVLLVRTNNDTSIFSSGLESAMELNDIEVTTNMSDSVYEVEGLPSSVKVTVTGDTNDVQSVSNDRDNLQVLADLSSLDEGTHEVSLTPVNFSSKVGVSVEPSSAIVTIKKKISKSYNLGYDFINENKLDKVYVLGEPELSQSSVIVRASQDTMDQISFVKALIDVNGVKDDFAQDANIVAYNQKGEQMKVDIIPNTVRAKVKVSSPHKAVPIVINPKGNLAKGKAIDSYTLDNETIVIYGKQSVLDKIDKIYVNVPVDGIKDNTKITTPVVLPSGVKTSSISKVTIDLKIGDAKSKTIDNLKPTTINLQKGLSVDFDSENTYSVTIKGTSKQIDSINANDIKIEADLSEYKEPGTYEVTLSVKANNKLAKYKLNNKTVMITIKGE